MALGSPEAGREFLVRACGVLVHGASVLFEEGDDGRGGRKYALPGGHLEFGETLTDCMSREFYEETGLNVEADKLLYVHENFYTMRAVVTHELGFYFLVDLSSEFPTPDARGYIPNAESHTRMRLLPLDALADHPVVPSFLQARLPSDTRDRFRAPTQHVVTQEG